jgi:hypothetical protein
VRDGQQLEIKATYASRHRPCKRSIYTIYSCNSDNATDDARSPEVYKLGSYTADYSDLPTSAWETKTVGGDTIFRACFTTVMETGSADIVFKVVYKDKVYGSARMSYVSMGEGLRHCT